VGISIVAGNVPLEVGSRNARYVVELCGAKTPVYHGLERSLLREPSWAWLYHGKGGMSGLEIPEPNIPPQSTHAVTALIEAVNAAPDELTLVTLGPLTNIATALRLEPGLAGKIQQCYAMGGAAATIGNTTPAAEYNIWVDPEAARIVFHSGLPVLLVGWEHSRGAANLSYADMASVRAFSTPWADFTLDCSVDGVAANMKWLGEVGLSLPDPVTMAIALDPAVCTARGKHFVDVETVSELTRGMTVVDRYGYSDKEPNIEVCWEIDPVAWKEVLYKTLR